MQNASGAGRALDLELVAVIGVEVQEAAEDEVVDREPHRPPPVRIAAEHATVGFGGDVADLVGVAVDVDPEGVVGVGAGHGAEAVGAEELVLVEHAGEDASQLGFVDHREHPAAFDAAHAGVVDGGQQLGHGIDASPEAGEQIVADAVAALWQQTWWRRAAATPPSSAP